MVRSMTRKSRWWDGDVSQRYWMELINVPGYGSELIAPDTARHDLMKDVRVGDVVLHWVGKSNPKRWKSGLYGASIVAGELRPRAGEWYGQPANTISLTGYTALPEPYLLTDLRRKHQEDILGIKGDLERALVDTTGHVLHFPFQRHPSSGLKPNQGYLFKVPAEVIRAVEGLLPEGWADTGSVVGRVAPPRQGQNGGRQRHAGFCADPVLRKAIEMQAVRQAISHYEAAGYRVEDVGAFRSYDLVAIRGDEERHVEVKGSQTPVRKIVLTRNEVDHANDFEATDLAVVEEITWERHLDGSLTTHEGTLILRQQWRPSPEYLRALSFDYDLEQRGDVPTGRSGPGGVRIGN